MNDINSMKEVVVEDSEHEEGEISSEDDDDNNNNDDDSEDGEITCLSPYPSECRSSHRPRCYTARRSAPVTSEVVIYDDNGRTAIFTSPKKSNSIRRNLDNFIRTSEGCKKWLRDDGPGRRERPDISSRREREEAFSRREREESNNRKRDDIGGNTSTSKGDPSRRGRLLPSSKGKLGARWPVGKGALKNTAAVGASVKRGSCSSRNRGHKRVPSSDTSSENTSFTISSASEDESISSPLKPIRGEGKENKSCSSVSKYSREPSSQLACGSTRPPPRSTIVRPPLHRKTSSKTKPFPLSVALRKETPKSVSMKRLPSKHQNSKTFHDSKSEPKAEECSMEELVELAKRAGLKKPPPGSLGEMLLKKRIKNQLKEKDQSKDCSASNQATEKNGNNEGVAEGKEKAGGLVSDMSSEGGLDQEDEDELQLRLLALQSSLRYLNDIRKEGALALSNSGCTTPVNLHDGKTLPIENDNSTLQQLEKNLPLLQLENVLAERAEESSPLRMDGSLQENVQKQIPMVENDEGKKDFNGVKTDMSGDRSPEYIDVSSSPEHELVTGGYELGQPDGENIKQRCTKSEECNGTGTGSTKYHQDSNQDPVDMDICDSSGDEEEDVQERDSVQVVVKDNNQEIRDFTENTSAGTFNSNDFPSGSSEGMSGNSDTVQNNFQIPVEWAYMMPPPPPPDQPANNIDNFSSWCYDQNMYLQSMQVSYDTSNTQCCQHGIEDINNEEWSQQQQMAPNSQWSSPSRDNNEHVTDASLIQPPYPAVQENSQFESVDTENQRVFQEEPKPKDLKDLPAEQYQAFMSAVLKQQTTSKKGSFSDRTLIQVPIVKIDVPTTPLTRKGEARRRKRERQKQKTKKSECVVGQKSEISSDASNMNSGSEESGVASQLGQSETDTIPEETLVSNREQPGVNCKSASVLQSGAEEEDEDLLRAQLLIDMSIRKQQKELPPKSTSRRVPKASVSSKSLGKNVAQKISTVSAEKKEKKIKYNFPPSSDLPSGTISHKYVAPKKKKHMMKSRGEEGSPSRVLKKDGRATLSDIGGFGLDPKSSQFHYQGSRDSSSHVESQKLKFPPIKPVIISLKSDSEDEEPPCSQEDSSDAHREPEAEASTSIVFSQSLDMLLKSMRNAKPASPSGKKSETPKASSSKVNTKNQQSDNTPQAVRHLSRHQQVEYRRLKELLRKKEILQHKKMQQKRSGVTTADGRLQTVTPSMRGSTLGESTSSMNVISSHVPGIEEWQCGGGKAASGRAVSWREMGRLKIQLSNIASTLDKKHAATASSLVKLRDEVAQKPFNTVDTPVGSSPRDTSATEEDEEDEETLRMMVLDTLKKNKKQREVMVEAGSEEEAMSSATEVNDTVEAGKPLASLKVVIHQKMENNEESSGEVEVKNPQGDSTRVVMLSERPNLTDGEDQNDSQTEQDDTLAGEWMVLDQVVEEDSEGSTLEEAAEEANSKAVKNGTEKECLGNDANDSEAPKHSDCETLDDVSNVEKMKNESVESDTGTGKRKASDNTNTLVHSIKEHCVCKDESPLENLSENNSRITNSMHSDHVESKEQIKGGGSTDMKNTQSSVNESSHVPYIKESEPKPANTSQEDKVQNDSQSKINVQDKDSKIEGKTGEITSETDHVQVKPVGHSCSTPPTVIPEQPCITDESFETSLATQNGTQLSSQEDCEAKCESQDKEQRNTLKIPDKVKKVCANVSSSLLKKKNVAHSHDTKKLTQALKKEIELKKAEQEKITELKIVEKMFTDKRHGMNRIISQLDVLVKEATREEQQRQTLKKTVTQLSAQLAEIESQLETKADALKIKMEKIRSLHKSILVDRQLIGEIQKRGELLGREVCGNNYSLPKLSMSPHSKTRDVHAKIALASSIDALRRVRDGNSTTSLAASAGSNTVRLKTSLNKHVKSAKQQVLLKSPVLKGENTHNASCQNTLTKSVEQTRSTSDESILTVTKAKSFLQTKGSVGATPAVPINKAVKRKIPPADNCSMVKMTKTQGPRQSIRQGIQVQGSQHTAANSNRNNGLDEMSELCPHDLLGRCNDDACIYQHLGNSPSTSHPTTQPRKVVQVSRGSCSDSRLCVEANRSNSSTLCKNVGKGRDAIVKSTSLETGVGNIGIDSKMGKTTGVKTDIRSNVVVPEVGSGTAELKETLELSIQSCPSHENEPNPVMCKEKSITSQFHVELDVSQKNEKNESTCDNSTEVQKQSQPLVSSGNDDKSSSLNQKIGITECGNVIEEENGEGDDNVQDQNVKHMIDIQSLNNSENAAVCTTIVEGLVDAPVEIYQASLRHDTRQDGKIDILSIAETSNKICIQEVSSNSTNTDRVVGSSSQNPNTLQGQNEHHTPSDDFLEERADEMKNKVHKNEKACNKEKENTSEDTDKDPLEEPGCSEMPIHSVGPTDLDEVPVMKRGNASKRSLSIDCSTKTRRGRKRGKPVNKKVCDQDCDGAVTKTTNASVVQRGRLRSRRKRT
ncbi:hypothetical protein Pcinc_034710 [Petrolisthes cinctipes]|uniref:Zinc-finger domain-containing protein n=1 Tax=Petrolisthes cinctipes TaxID=88211 RepID=A0AAE1C128_PETCI|nr:hypothetical protein Pcinc_034710 [Petrolisthes cinctipes]